MVTFTSFVPCLVSSRMVVLSVAETPPGTPGLVPGLFMTVLPPTVISLVSVMPVVQVKVPEGSVIVSPL